MKSKGKGGEKGIKVVYISSPMKVKASASEFRALVQQLTGKDSDATRFMDANGICNELLLSQGTVGGPQESVFPFINSYQEPSIRSDSAFDKVLFPTFDQGGFMSMFESSFFCETSQSPFASLESFV
ncbi:hypothetical protein K2173_009411 [Erythroxylum novogranatense]|uniref:VQ domain-containing protein n=1 Tax=Erythroxylum novogranatense TaxID=1862640 RepID=A0AAV8U403_9ROSI|nr:hypothetical protein K2173_009411 [Erythroxylum novogranatense]